MMVKAPRVGVLLLNFGGPETLDDVKPFLYHLFADPEVIRLPFIIREPLARLMAAFRHKQSRGYYEKIGGGSPLRRITEQQGAALKAALQQQGYDIRIYIGMQCWRPFIQEAVRQIFNDRLTHVIVLPLFPQFSVTTTRACLVKFDKQVKKLPEWPIEQLVIEPWYDHPIYIQSLTEMIREELKKFSSEDVAKVHLLFSAHSIPQKYVDQGDPYAEQTRQTVELIMERLGRRNPYHLAFQSRLGPVRWLQPYTDKLIEELGREGVNHVLTIPISFVSEHIETLYEIDMLYQDIAREAGISNFRRVPAPNTYPTFIRALASLVQTKLAAFNLAPASLT
ncbi:MAG: ferrochelatase [Acidobacteria bacterium]|nr:ferrochelatase [Acidobacteriota bacterium]